MGYKRSILARWSRRDWLTVLIVAVASAFLVGTTVLLLTAGTHAATVSGDLETGTTATYYESVDEADANADGDAIVFPIAAVSDENGRNETVVGIPPHAPTELDDATTSWDAATVPSPNDSETVLGPVSEATTERFDGRNETVSVTVTPNDDDTIFPPWWYAADSSTVETVGPTGAIVVDTGDGVTRDDAAFLRFDRFDRGVPLVSALAFLLAGMLDVLRVLGVIAVGGAVIVMVVLYSVTRISVQERLETIEVIRSTGGTPATVLVLYAFRATLIALVGVLLGFVAGVGAAKLSVEVATHAGIPVTLEPRLTAPVLRVLGPMLATLVVVGCLAGAIAARRAATRSVIELRSQARRGPYRGSGRGLGAFVPSVIAPTLLDWRTVVPTTATLAVFVVLVLLIGGIGAAVAPLNTAETGTITAPGDHPIDSRLDASTAAALQEEGIDASPELVITQVTDGQPYLARGANYDDFAAVTDAKVVEGKKPTAPDEAVIESSLAETLGVAVGDSVTLGGSDGPAVTRVTVVGVYETDRSIGAQLVVPLETGHHLSLESGTVHVIRTDANVSDVFDGNATGPAASANENLVQHVDVPEAVAVDEPTTIGIRVRNDGTTSIDRTLEIAIGRETYDRDVSLDPGEAARLEIDHAFESTGRQTVAAGGRERNVTVLEPETPVFPETLPEDAPPGSSLLVRVMTATGDPAAAATVAVDGDETRTDADGTARISLPETTGAYELRATTADGDEATHPIRVASGRNRTFGATLEIVPRTGTAETEAEVTATVTNHWTVERTQEVSIASPAGETPRTVTLGPGESTTTETRLGATGSSEQLPPGEYEVAVTADGEPIAMEEYEVNDDADFEALPSEGQYRSGTAMGHVVESTIGNIHLLLATMTALAGLMVVGSTTATFAQAVHARREAIAIHRSTGGSRKRMLKIVVLDAFRLAIPAVSLAAIVAIASITVLDGLGLLVVFGVRFVPAANPLLVIVTSLGALFVAVCGAVIALVPTLRSSPAAVWDGTGRNGGPNRSAETTGTDGTDGIE